MSAQPQARLGSYTYHTVQDVAAMLGISVQTVYSRIRFGRIFAIRQKPQGHYHIPASEVKRLTKDTPPFDRDAYLTVAQAAKSVGVSPQMVRDMITFGLVEGVDPKLLAGRYIPREDIEPLLRTVEA